MLPGQTASIGMPPEAPKEWKHWSEETRYVYCERLAISGNKYTALDEARAHHEQEQRALRLF